MNQRQAKAADRATALALFEVVVKLPCLIGALLLGGLVLGVMVIGFVQGLLG